MPNQHGREHGDHLADICAEQEADHLADIRVNAAALAHRVDDRRKIVVGQRHIRRALRDVRTRDAHRAADVRRFQGRRVVHAVARHGRDELQPAKRLDNAHFVRRRDPRVHGTRLHRLQKRVVRKAFQLRTRHHSFIFNAEPSGNG